MVRQRHGDDLRARVLNGRLDEVQIVAAGTENEAARELVSAEDQWIGVTGGDFVIRVRIRFRQQCGVRGGADQLVERGVRCCREVFFRGGDRVFGAHG